MVEENNTSEDKEASGDEKERLYSDLKKALDIPDDQLDDRIDQLLKGIGTVDTWPKSWITNEIRAIGEHAEEVLGRPSLLPPKKD